MKLNRIFNRQGVKSLLSFVVALPLLAACAAPVAPAASAPAAADMDATTAATAAGTGEPIYLGVSGPLTGPNARYGEQWQKGFDLALDAINAAGGIDGRPLAYIFEDSQSDPKQSVLVAQKFVADPRIGSMHTRGVAVDLGLFSLLDSLSGCNSAFAAGPPISFEVETTLLVACRSGAAGG